MSIRIGFVAMLLLLMAYFDWPGTLEVIRAVGEAWRGE